MKRSALAAALLLSALPTALTAQRGNRMAAATTDTTVPNMVMGDHMQMSIKSEPKPGDTERAAKIAATAKEVLVHYKSFKTAIADGYRPMFDSGKMGAEIHFINPRLFAREQQHVDYNHPGSILYKRTPEGLVAVGVMYTAAASADVATLNAVAPMSIAPWHRHVDICTSTSTPFADQIAPGGKFGLSGSIHTESACKAAGGIWVPRAFNWMTHVYPNEADPEKVWGGAEMNMSDDDM